MPGKRELIVGSISGGVATVPLTKGNIKNSHFYLRTVLDFFPPESIGGARATDRSLHPLTIAYVGGAVSETDIAGGNKPHLFFRNRGDIKNFFAESGAEAGDSVENHRDSPTGHTVTLVKAPSKSS